MENLIKNNLLRVTAVLAIIIGFFIYRSYSDKYKITFELSVDYKPWLVNSAIYRDSLFNAKVKYISTDLDGFFNEFSKNNIPLKKYFKGENDEEIISLIKQEQSQKLDFCYETIDEKIGAERIYASIEKLENCNLEVKYDMTEDYDKLLRIFKSPDMPLPLERVRQIFL